MKTMAHADAARSVLTQSRLDAEILDGAEPKCRLCGHPLRAGDWIDPFHPWERKNNAHKRCAAEAEATDAEPVTLAPPELIPADLAAELESIATELLAAGDIRRLAWRLRQAAGALRLVRTVGSLP